MKTFKDESFKSWDRSASRRTFESTYTKPAICLHGKEFSIKVQFENEEEALKVKWRDLVIPTTDGWTKKKMKLHAIMKEVQLFQLLYEE